MAGFLLYGGKFLTIFFFIGVYAYGFERPSAIQQRAIMPIIQGKFIFNPVKYIYIYFFQGGLVCLTVFQVTMSSLRPSLVPERLPPSPLPLSRRLTPI